MALYQNINGVWTLCQRPYVLRNGVWTACMEAWVKRSGTWVQAYEYDVTPPNPPQVSLSVVESFTTSKAGVKSLDTRFIQVGIRLPGVANDPDARLVRVLTNHNGGPPTTQFGGTYTTYSDSSFPNEPWSEWRYNDFGVHDTSVIANKQWPRNATSGSIVKSDFTYYFTAWSLDQNGNWSVSTPASIHIPKASIDMPNVVTKEARFQANSSGTWRNDGYHGGDLLQQKSPRAVGLWFYGNQFGDSFNQPVAATTVKKAQIYIKRENDTGQANANIYLYWTKYGTVASLPVPGSAIGKTDITKVGTLAKGQGAWFDLPDSFTGDLKAGNIKSIGLDWKDPVKADGFLNDFSLVTGVASNLRCGEVYALWEEQH